MMIKDLYRKTLVELQAVYSLTEATVITDWLFEYTCKINKPEIVSNPFRIVNVEEIKKIEEYVQQLLTNKPIQYVLGKAWFYNLLFFVTEHTLIPRPETEELVELIIKENNGLEGQLKILDIGTGSGCIPIVLKKMLPNFNITAIDFSEDALHIAQKNAEQHHVLVNFFKVDFLDNINWNNLGEFDIIVSNPPYIPCDEKEILDKTVTQFEPHTALFVPNKNPFIFYEKIMEFAKQHLNPNGIIYVETHENYALQVQKIFMEDAKNTKLIKDISGKERMVVAYY